MSYQHLFYNFYVDIYLSFNANFGVQVPILSITLLAVIPESPHYLAMKGDSGRALESLSWLRPSDGAVEIEEELRSMATATPPAGGSAAGLFKTSGRALAIVLVMGTCQIFSGISALEAYASTAFERADHSETAMTMTADACAVTLGLMAVASDLLSALIIDRFGRRPLLLASCVCCSVSHAAAAYGLYRGRHHEPLVLAALVGAVVSANAGLMPLVTTIVCEYFPTGNRAQANGVTQLVMTAASLVSLKVYQPVADAYGVHVNFAVFAGVAAFSTAFVYRFIPETKGKTFGEIEMLFSRERKSAVAF